MTHNQDPPTNSSQLPEILPEPVRHYQGNLSRIDDLSTAASAGEAARQTNMAVCEAVWGIMHDGIDRNDSEIAAALKTIGATNPKTQRPWRLVNVNHGRLQIQRAGYLVAVTKRRSLAGIVPEAGGRMSTTWRATARLSLEEFRTAMEKATAVPIVTRKVAQSWKDALNDLLPRTLPVDPRIISLMGWLEVKVQRKAKKKEPTDPT